MIKSFDLWGRFPLHTCRMTLYIAQGMKGQGNRVIGEHGTRWRRSGRLTQRINKAAASGGGVGAGALQAGMSPAASFSRCNAIRNSAAPRSDE